MQAKVCFSNVETMSDAEKKKAQKKAKKAEMKHQEQAEVASGADGETPKPVKIDLDPQGLKYLTNVKPLDAVIRFLKPLNELSPDDLDGWLFAYEVYMRKSIFH